MYIGILGVPKTTFRLSDLLEGLKGLRKAIILTDTVYYSERIQVKISKGKRHIGRESKRNQTEASSCPLPAELYEQCLILPARDM